jgi:uncharacterized protein
MSSNDPLPISGPDDEQEVLEALLAPESTPPSPPAPRPRRRWPIHPNFWWSILWCIGFLLVTQILPALCVIAPVSVLQASLLREAENPPPSPAGIFELPLMRWALLATFFASQLVAIAFSLLVIRLVVGRDWTRQLALRPPALPHLLLAIAAAPGLVVGGDAVYYFLRKIALVPSISDAGVPGMEEMSKIFGQWPLPLAILAIGVGPGLSEELWCRGFLGRGLVGRYGFVAGVIFSSFFFGLLHVDPAQGAMAMVMGLFLHYTYLTTRSLYVPMLLHCINNSTAVLFARLETVELIKSPEVLPPTIYVAAASLLFVAILALWRSRARLVPSTFFAPPWPLPNYTATEIDTRAAEAESWKPEYAGVEYPPPGSGTHLERPGAWPGFFITLAALVAFALTCWMALRGSGIATP